MPEIHMYWAPSPEDLKGKSSRLAKVAADPLRQAFVEVAMQQGFSYPAQFVRVSGIRHDTLSNFMRGKTVLSPDNFIRAFEVLKDVWRDDLWGYYGDELIKGNGSFTTVRSTQKAHNVAVKSHVTRRNGKMGKGEQI